MGLHGTAGAGKTTSLVAVNEAAEREGYQVEGLAPTSRAAQQLEDAGIASCTLQHHLARSNRSQRGQKHLYIVDESSLASSRQVKEFLHRLEERDRVLFVGDSRQHQGVEAGRPFQQLQEAGLHTVHLDEVVRQRDLALKQAVQELANGEVSQAVESLKQQGRVHEITDRQERFQAIAKVSAESPQQTLVVSPDNQSRQEINQFVHRELQSQGAVKPEEHALTVLLPRQELTGADRQWAAQYETDDILRYTRGSKTLGIKPGEYGRVIGMDREKNLLRVQRADGSRICYDPVRLQGVNVYREGQRDLSEGDRIQFTTPLSRAAYRQPGTRDGRTDRWPRESPGPAGFRPAGAAQHPGASSSGLRLRRHQPQQPGSHRRPRPGARRHYVAVSRGRYDAQIYTNDTDSLSKALSKDTSKISAIEAENNVQSRNQEHVLEVPLAEGISRSIRVDQRKTCEITLEP